MGESPTRKGPGYATDPKPCETDIPNGCSGPFNVTLCIYARVVCKMWILNRQHAVDIMRSIFVIFCCLVTDFGKDCNKIIHYVYALYLAMWSSFNSIGHNISGLLILLSRSLFIDTVKLVYTDFIPLLYASLFCKPQRGLLIMDGQGTHNVFNEHLGLTRRATIAYVANSKCPLLFTV